MKNKSFQEQLAELRLNTPKVSPGGGTRSHDASAASKSDSSPLPTAIPGSPQSINTSPSSLSQPSEDPLSQAQSAIRQLISKITELQHQLDLANADRAATSDELRNQRGHMAELAASNEALTRQNFAIEDERAQLDMARRKLGGDETIALELMEQAATLQRALEAERKSIESDQRMLAESLAAHESELLQLKAVAQLQQEVGLADCELKTLQRAIERRDVGLAEKERELAERELKISGDEDLTATNRKLERSLRALTKNFDAKVDELDVTLEKYRKASEGLKQLKILVNELTAASEQLKTQIVTLERANKRLSTGKGAAERLAAELQECFRLTPEIQIKSIETVRWLTEGFEQEEQAIFDREVLMVGEGPWGGDDFQGLLQDRQFEVYRDGYAEHVEVLIIGRTGWTEDILNSQLECRDGKLMRVYSQELFVIALMLGIDPLDSENHEALFRIVQNHPAFDFLLEQELPWPDYQPGTGEGEFTQSGADHSPLFELGYSVAKVRGLSAQQRRVYLDDAMQVAEPPWVVSDDYMAEWGEANSRKRLHRIAWHISMCTRTHNQHDEAVSKWEADLSYLKRQLLQGLHAIRLAKIISKLKVVRNRSDVA